MTATEQDWTAVYEPRLGSALSEVVLLAYDFEVRDVANAMNEQVIPIEGAVGLVFEGHEPMALTWQQFGGPYDFGLASASVDFCGPFGLDRVRVGHEGGWGTVRGAVLEKVSLQAYDDAPEGVIAGIGHHLRSEAGQHVLWVFIGAKDHVAPFDGQIVTIDTRLPGADILVDWRVIQ